MRRGESSADDALPTPQVTTGDSSCFESGPVSAADGQPAAEKEPKDWPTAYRNDLQAARRTILESHPGPVDAMNPGFLEWLDTGFEQQMAHQRAPRGRRPG